MSYRTRFFDAKDLINISFCVADDTRPVNHNIGIYIPARQLADCNGRGQVIPGAFGCNVERKLLDARVPLAVVRSVLEEQSR